MASNGHGLRKCEPVPVIVRRLLSCPHSPSPDLDFDAIRSDKLKDKYHAAGFAELDNPLIMSRFAVRTTAFPLAVIDTPHAT